MILGQWAYDFGCIRLDIINKIVSKNLMIELPKIKFSKEKKYDAWQTGNKHECLLNKKNVFQHQNLLSFPIKTSLFGPRLNVWEEISMVS